MGLYRYEAVDKLGKVVHGAMNASDEQQVARNLSQMGYSARAIYPPGGKPSSATVSQPAMPQQPVAAAPSAVSTGVPISVKSVVPARQLASFFRQIATLVKSGIPLYQSFTDMAMVTRNKHLRRVLPKMQQSLQNGQKLSGAMAAFPEVFPVHTTASVWSGELAGKLDIMLEEVAIELEKEASDTRYGSIGWGITKLTAVFCVFMLPLCDLSKVLAPTIDINTRNALTSVGKVALDMTLKALPIAILMVILFMIWGRLKHVPVVRKTLDSIVLRMPVWGKLHKYRSVARFLHVLDSLYQAGITPQAAWDAAALTAKNNEIAGKLKMARVNLVKGEGAADMFQAAGVFEIEDVGMASAGEKAGRLPEALQNLAAIYEDRASGLKTMGRMWSISMLITSQIVLTGVAVIMMVYSFYVKFPKDLGVGF